MIYYVYRRRNWKIRANDIPEITQEKIMGRCNTKLRLNIVRKMLDWTIHPENYKVSEIFHILVLFTSLR